MVRASVSHKNVMLAYQPVVQAQNPNRIAFFEALIRVLDDTQRVIPAREFITVIEETELGREIDCLALQKGLTAMVKVPRSVGQMLIFGNACNLFRDFRNLPHPSVVLLGLLD